MEITRSIVIASPIEEVFAFVAEATNDPLWCPKVRSTVQTQGEGPGPGAVYDVVHQPIPLRPARQMENTCVSWDPPTRIEWHEDDGADTFRVTYTLEEGDGATRLSQRSLAKLASPRLLDPVMRHGIGRDIARQLTTLKGHLEKQLRNRRAEGVRG